MELDRPLRRPEPDNGLNKPLPLKDVASLLADDG